ncbi:MAG TPA: transporter, partial [Roseibacterium sp.]|nr:transporter [Roseibacterium sp.]
MAFGFKKRGRCALLAVTLASVGAFPVQADSLRQVMVDAYRHSNLLEQNRYLLRIQDEGVAQAIARLRPVISFVASMSRDVIN